MWTIAERTRGNDKVVSRSKCRQQMEAHPYLSSKRLWASLVMATSVSLEKCQNLSKGEFIEGKRLETFCNALGMKVLISDRKNGPVIRHDTNNREDKPAVRTPFEEVIRSAIVLFLSCTFDEGSCNMIDAPELSAMRPEMIIINVSRGGAMRTSAVVQALQEKRISGAGVDAYDQEPASTEDDSRFLAENTKDLNLTFSPHTGYFSTKTILTMKSMVQDHISHFISGDFTRFEK